MHRTETSNQNHEHEKELMMESSMSLNRACIKCVRVLAMPSPAYILIINEENELYIEEILLFFI
jgi:hypothetical protein